jgi:hypothetical protein
MFFLADFVSGISISVRKNFVLIIMELMGSSLRALQVLVFMPKIKGGECSIQIYLCELNSISNIPEKFGRKSYDRIRKTKSESSDLYTCMPAAVA